MASAGTSSWMQRVTSKVIQRHPFSGRSDWGGHLNGGRGNRSYVEPINPAVSGFGTALRQKRKERNWSQAKLGSLAGISTSHISRLEDGSREPSLTTLTDIADALDITGVERVFFFASAGRIEHPLTFQAANAIVRWQGGEETSHDNHRRYEIHTE